MLKLDDEMKIAKDCQNNEQHEGVYLSFTVYIIYLWVGKKLQNGLLLFHKKRSLMACTNNEDSDCLAQSDGLIRVLGPVVQN